MKKALSLILATLFVLSTMSCLSVVSFGADIVVTEVEENDSATTAQAISANEIYTGSLYNAEDVDWYKFESDKDYFMFNLRLNEGNLITSDWAWNVYIYDGNLNLLKEYTDVFNISSPKINITGTIYVKIKANNIYNNSIVGICYDIEGITVEDSQWEDEGNDESAKACVINTNETYVGSLYKATDVDWYKFESNEDYFSLHLNVNKESLASIDRAWDITIYDSSMNTVKDYDNTKTLNSAKIAMDGTFYVRVKADNEYSNYLNDIYYDLNVATTVDANWESENNDTSSKANVINTDETYIGSLHRATDVDWYVFNAEKSYFTLDFKLNAENLIDLTRGWDVTIYDASMNIVKDFSNYKSVYTAELAISGTVYVKISADNQYSDYLNDLYYDLKVTTYENATWESEYNNTSTNANSIKQNVLYKGTLMSESDIDYYKFKATSDAFKIRFVVDLNETSVEMIQGGWKISVYPADSASSVLSEYVVNTIGSFETITLPYEKGKEYFVKVYKNNSNEPVDAIYNIAIVDATDGNKWEVETGKTDLSSATTVKSGNKVYGNLYTGSDKDYYKINIPASGKLKVVFNREESELAGSGWKFSLIDAVGSVLETVDIGNSLNATWTSKTIVNEGNYYIKMESVNSNKAPSADIDYNLTFTYTMTAPKLSSMKNVSSGVELKWSKVEDCDGYYVYRKAGSGDWKKLTTIKGESKVSYTDKSAKTGTKYSYKVCAYDGSTKSEYSSSKTITFLSAPKAKSVSSSKSGVTFTWSKVSGASGYEVYRATGSGSYKKLVTVKSGSTVKFVDKSASKGKTYKYKVRAYKGDSTSAFSSVKTIKDKY